MASIRQIIMIMIIQNECLLNYYNGVYLQRMFVMFYNIAYLKHMFVILL